MSGELVDLVRRAEEMAEEPSTIEVTVASDAQPDTVRVYSGSFDEDFVFEAKWKADGTPPPRAGDSGVIVQSDAFEWWLASWRPQDPMWVLTQTPIYTVSSHFEPLAIVTAPATIRDLVRGTLSLLRAWPRGETITVTGYTADPSFDASTATATDAAKFLKALSTAPVAGRLTGYTVTGFAYTRTLSANATLGQLAAFLATVAVDRS